MPASASHTVTSASTTATTSPRAGRAVSSCAVAGGSASSANTSSEPVTWLTSATVMPSSTRNATSSARVGTPRLRASAASTDANSSGRPIAASAPSTTTAVIDQRGDLADVMPSTLPNSSSVVPLRNPL